MSNDQTQYTRVSTDGDVGQPILLPAFAAHHAGNDVGGQMGAFGTHSTGYVNRNLLAAGPPRRERTWVAKIFMLLLLTVLLAIGYFIFDQVSQGQEPLATVMRVLGFAAPTDQVSIEEEMAEAQEQARQRALARQAEAAQLAGPANPYWELPNFIEQPDGLPMRFISPEETQVWADGLKHRFTYQRFKTVNSIRNSKLRGSQRLLWQALSEKKFWTRMSALIGLVEFGLKIDVNIVEKAIGAERPSLVANYMKRFRTKSTAAERYVLRHAIKVVDAKARLEILAALNNTADDSRGLYLVAATYDPGKGIKSFAERAIARANLADDKRLLFTDIVVGKTKAPENLFASTAVANATPAATATATGSAPAQHSATTRRIDDAVAPRVRYYEEVKTVDVSEEGLVDDGFKEMEFIEIKPEEAL